MQEHLLTQGASNKTKLSPIGSFIVIAIYSISILLSGTMFFYLASFLWKMAK
jgi:hypothetical protein